MATTLEIIQGINQAAANAYDGSHDKRFITGEPKEIGLSREEGCAIVDSRVSDGFGVKIIGDMLQINYEANVRLSDVYAVGFEEECERRVHAIAEFLKKEFKVITGKGLSLTPEGENVWYRTPPVCALLLRVIAFTKLVACRVSKHSVKQ